jgi:Ca2+-binding EF-hand superfamily protein
MKQMKLLAVALAVALVSVAAFAQTATPGTAGGKARVQLDTNKDGAIDRTEAAKAPRLAENFDRLDKDKDGRLSADERPQMQARGHRRGGAHGQGRMRAADTDNDGRISRAEAQAAQAKAGDRFEQMDVNKDGYIDRADMQARVAQRRGECFGKADTDRNGQLSRTEFDNMGEACGAMRGGMHKRR